MEYLNYFKGDVPMRFENYTYVRPNLEEVTTYFDVAIENSIMPLL